MWRSSFFFLLVLALRADVFAQAPRDGRLLVTVIDPSGAIIPGATVTVAGLDDVTQRRDDVAVLRAADRGRQPTQSGSLHQLRVLRLRCKIECSAANDLVYFRLEHHFQRTL